ncbi:hypothetical protein ETD83_23015 [Actinomadura soli]|uniref:Secreted protein n=1 Tax=Actinomadura soli TaxID=2508997 RepID=A0A5C4J842_9ACTN|nr:hypothetical protein [Actinomadura soli]TMQ95078.1 hypothetical protein ETD83_23015 [Actinomadura soli]
MSGAVLMAVVALSAPPTSADAAGPPSEPSRCLTLPLMPKGFYKIADGYFGCDVCSMDGDYGIAHGHWPDYRGVLHFIGMDVYDALYVYP